MSKLIKQIYDLVQLATDKGITAYHTDAQIMDVVHSVQMTLWRDLIQQYPRTKRVRNDLLPFEKVATITASGGSGPMPSDYEHEIEAYVESSSIKYPVTIVENGFFRRRTLDPVDPPATANYFMRIYNDSGPKVEIAPAGITTIVLSYWKKPTKPVFATDLTSGQYQYNDTASTDVLWSDSLHDLIVERALKLLGVGMRDSMLVQVGNPPAPKESSI